ncbi:glycosyltransferase [Puia sp.]|uniref:glycosyltransferase n=1 Tax=Puia sp. TaxID=2045100 RepID=UPI002F3FDBC9
MLILLDCRPLQNAGPDSEKSRLIFSILPALTRDPQLQWLLVADRSRPIPELPGTTLITQRTLPGKLGWRFWYDRQLPRLAKKHKARLVMTTGGVAARSPLPQCCWMPERSDPKKNRPPVPLYAGRLGESLHRAGTLFCYFDRDREWLAARDANAAAKLVVLHPSPAASAAPPTPEGREQAKEEFAAGKEYFFADATAAGEEGVIYLLKAFSLFKKRQHSNLQLVVEGIAAEGLQKKLETYKYREDVHWCPPAAEGDSRLTGGAYATLFLFDEGSLGTPLLNAWNAGIPVIGKAGSPLQDLAGDASLGADGADPASLAGHLMSIYKDEQLRNRLINQGQTRVAEFGADRAINAVRSAITRAQ